MSTTEIRDLYEWLHLRFPGYKLDPAAEDIFVEDLSDLVDADVSEADLRRAARRCLERDANHVPHGILVRRQLLSDLGLLAPSWSDAHRLLGEASAGRIPWRTLPGPVRVLTTDDAHADYLKPVEERYLAAAREHDERVLDVGGVEELRLAAEWIDAVRAHQDRVVLARQCQASMGELPRYEMSDEEAQSAIDAWAAANGEQPALPSAPVDPDERWEPASNVRSLIARLRPRALGDAAGDGAA